jgi:hypothetical protein
MNPKLAFFLLVFLTACTPVPIATPPPGLTPTPTDELLLYRSALTPASQSDLALLDRPTRYNLTLTYTAERRR